MKRYLAIATLCVIMSAPAWAGIEEGMEAHKRGDYETALREFRPLAEHGDPVAQYSLGLMYYYGRGVRQDYGEALRWYRKAAEQGDAAAQYSLGLMYDSGEGVAKDKAEALKWYNKAAEQADEWWAKHRR